MNERHLQRLLRRMLVLSTPLPLALLGAACGGTALADPSGAGGESPSSGRGSGAASSQESGGAVSGGARDDGGAGAIGGGTSAGSANRGGSGGAHPGAGNGGALAVGGTGGAAGAQAGGGAGGAAGAHAGGGAGGSTNLCTASMFPDSCGESIVVIASHCLDPSLAKVGTGLPMATCTEICRIPPLLGCSVTAADAESVTIDCRNACVGRRPAGLEQPLGFDDCGVGGYFAEGAYLESASVAAFRILRDELRAGGAPKQLVHAAARAARDEIRHARATSALARRFGAQPRTARVERGPLRSRETMAIENAVEGCVRETFAALIATYQADHAQDPVVRATMTRIARDETRHAALSFRVARWLDTRLGAQAKLNVAKAQQAAARELLHSAALGSVPSFADLAGLPPPAEAARLAQAMTQTLWS